MLPVPSGRTIESDAGADAGKAWMPGWTWKAKYTMTFQDKDKVHNDVELKIVFQAF